MGDSRKGRKMHLAAGGFCLVSMFTLLAAGSWVQAAAQGVDEQISQALKGDWGQIKLNLRWRYENVDQDGKLSTDGDPIRLRLGYLTPNFAGFTAFAEFEGNTPVFADDYNDKANGKTRYAVIADPAEGELNQGWLAYGGIPDTVFKVGRQKILLDNQRFVGAVGWRQMEQTFDSVSLLNTSFKGLSAEAIYIWNVRTILSTDVNMSSPLLNVKYAFEGIGSLTAYGYWLDYDDPDDSGPFAYGFSTQTYGLRFNGRTSAADNLDVLYTAEYGFQSDYQDNPADYTADYYHLTGGLVLPYKDSMFTNLTAKVGWEVLGSDNGVSFKTPLGTNHGFNGWVDMFLTAPADGVEDLYGMLGATLAGFKLQLIYHDFQANEGGSDYGSEFDAMLTRKFGSHYIAQAAWGDYNSDEYKVDTQKFWLQLTVTF